MKDLNTRGEDGSISGMSDGSLSYNYGQKFKKEAINLSQLDHPNIVRVTDSFEENGTYYYVMDYIEGENLNDYLKHNAIYQQEAVSIITDVAKALQYMHDTKHMLHLDLKPGNIMRRASDGHIFLIDFGLSKHYSNSGQPETSTTIGLGTPGYAPIEQSNQAKNGEFRPTIDVYALGATLYKLLTRETPPAASDIVSDDELIEDKLRANGITGNIIDVVVNAMLPNVKKRTQTVKDFIEALNSNSTLSHTAQNTNSIHVEEVKPANEETCIIGQTNPSTEKVARVKPQAFNIDQYKIPVYFSTDPKDTERRAIAGNEEAMFALAMMYLRGEGKFQDFDAAYRWLNTCKTNGDGRAVALLNNWEFLKKKYKKAEAPREENKIEQPKTENDSSISKGGILIIVLVVLVACIYGIGQCSNNSGNNNYDSFELDSTYVENYEIIDYDSCTYYWTGYISNGLPTGDGKAKYSSNDYYGRKEYSGKMTVGVRQDENAILTFNNGDYYQGSFDYDKFKEGTYYSFSTGEKFVGSFSNNQPYNGKWYGKNGSVVGTVKNGR